MNPLSFRSIISDKFFFLLKALLFRHRKIFFNLRKFHADFWKDKEFGIFAFARNQIQSFLSKLYTVVFFINDKIKRCICVWHLFLVVLQMVDFYFLQNIF